VRRAVLVRRGASLVLVPPSGGPIPVGTAAADPAAAAEAIARGFPGGLPGPVREAIARAAGGPVAVDDPVLGPPLARAGLAVAAATPEERRDAREVAGAAPTAELRAFVLADARRALAEAFADPETELIALAREEARLERALGRERSAAGEFPPSGTDAAESYRRSAEALARALERHVAEVRGTVGDLAARVAPNLTALVGPIVTGRLVAAAGGLAPLARMPSSRLQLLGSRRRPSPTHGPKYGLLYRAPRLAELPASAWGAYARSLAALAVIAARADRTTRRELAAELVRRRDRRIEALRRRR